ncbi:MAG: hypothetical protein AAFQ88_04555 [Pseudomonadota bacterium]
MTWFRRHGYGIAIVAVIVLISLFQVDWRQLDPLTRCLSLDPGERWGQSLTACGRALEDDLTAVDRARVEGRMAAAREARAAFDALRESTPESPKPAYRPR